MQAIQPNYNNPGIGVYNHPGNPGQVIVRLERSPPTNRHLLSRHELPGLDMDEARTMFEASTQPAKRVELTDRVWYFFDRKEAPRLLGNIATTYAQPTRRVLHENAA